MPRRATTEEAVMDFYRARLILNNIFATCYPELDKFLITYFERYQGKQVSCDGEAAMELDLWLCVTEMRIAT